MGSISGIGDNGNAGILGTVSNKPSAGYRKGLLYGTPWQNVEGHGSVLLSRNEAYSTPFYSEGGDFNAVRLTGGTGATRICQVKIFRRSDDDRVGEEMFASSPLVITNTTIFFATKTFERGWYDIFVGIHISSTVFTEGVHTLSGQFAGSIEHGLPSNIVGIGDAGRVVSRNIDLVSEGDRFSSTKTVPPILAYLRAT